MGLEDIVGSNQKYRMTNQRQVILEEIQKVNTHPTADEVYEIVWYFKQLRIFDIKYRPL